MDEFKNSGKNILIGSAWPYANGSLHLGHVAALLPGDVIARYYRMTGGEVLLCSGSDCHGTPISVKAHSENTTPEIISQKYHDEFVNTFRNLNIIYDIYTRTSTEFHEKEVQKMFIKLYEKNLLYKENVKMAYCVKCDRFLPDRYVLGVCNKCGYEDCRGDQCDKCGNLVEIEDLGNKRCTICSQEPQIRNSEHLFFKMSEFQDRVQNFVDKNKDRWRQNAVSLSNRYLKENLKDRAITRDLDWGIDIPIDGFKDKKVYVWFEAVLGYLTSSMLLSQEKNDESYWQKFWNDDALAYYVHGKDNIPFHTLILPSLLMGLDISGLPTHLISSEYLTIEGQKLSTSRNWAIWADDFLTRYSSDSLRYFLIINGPEKRDSDFSWNEFLERNNSELLGTYGNLVNRVLTLSIKSFGNKVPEEGALDDLDRELLDECSRKFELIGNLIEKGDLRDALKNVFGLAKSTNKYLDRRSPWNDLKNDNYTRAATTLKVCIDMIINISSMCYPFIPETSEKALSFLNLKPKWNFRLSESGNDISDPEILVFRLDKSIIEEERARLGS